MAFIYLLRNDDGEYKIGFTKNSTEKRVKQLLTGTSQDISIEYIFETKHNRKVETALHNLYSHKNIKREFFRLSIEEVKNFISKCELLERNFDILECNNMYLNKNGGL
jgi:predicted GIY-YIG superfamily endonuclease